SLRTVCALPVADIWIHPRGAGSNRSRPSRSDVARQSVPPHDFWWRNGWTLFDRTRRPAIWHGATRWPIRQRRNGGDDENAETRAWRRSVWFWRDARADAWSVGPRR